MKLPIKDRYFQELKEGKKKTEFRDAHITFVNEKTGETLRKEVVRCCTEHNSTFKALYPGEITEDKVVIFTLE